MSDPDAQIEQDFTAGQRRRKIIAAIVSVAVVATVAAVILVSRANKLPGLDPEQVRKVREALEQIPPEYRSELAAAALVELEHERLPAGLLEPFDDLRAVPPDMADLILLRALAEDPEVQAAWLLACPDGVRVVADAGTHGGGAQAVYERCELGRLGLLGETELGGASIGKLVVTHAAWAHLVEHDSETDIERRLLRTVLGRR